MKKTIFTCYYSKGEYDGYQEIYVFSTFNESIAVLWVDKMNRIIPKIRQHHLDICEKWEKSKYSFKLKTGINKWHEFNEAGCFELELR